MEASEVITLKDWLPLIGVGLGAVLGFLTSLASNIYFERKRVSEEKKNLALAFGGEISAILHIVEIRKYIETLKMYVAHMEAHNEPVEVSIPVKRNYFNVYESNVGKIGWLGGCLPKKVATFYTLGNSVLEDLERLDKGVLEGMQMEGIIEYYNDLINVFEAAVAVGQQIIQEIDVKYS